MPPDTPHRKTEKPTGIAQAHPRLVMVWRPRRDFHLLSDLARYAGRSRGARLRYLARLGQLVEALGFRLDRTSADPKLDVPLWMNRPAASVETGVSTTAPNSKPKPDPLLRFAEGVLEDLDAP